MDEFTIRRLQKVRTLNYIKAVSFFINELKKYYGNSKEEKFIFEKAHLMFSEKKKNGFYNELNEPINNISFKKSNVIQFKKA